MEKVTVNGFSTIVRLTAEETKEICKLGQGEKCCAYLVMSTEGFECAKQEPSVGIQIYHRLKQGLMVAKGEGSWEGCPWEEK
jgi:hypothetical protein